MRQPQRAMQSRPALVGSVAVKAQRVCMRDQVRNLIVERILHGSYPPGTRLKELALAAECKVSQAPVREALRELVALGLVESERYRGSRVREVDPRELRQAYELSALLEERAAQLAVPCSEPVLAELERQLARMLNALKSKNFEVYSEAAILFHRGLIVASANQVFLAAWDNLHWEVRTHVAVRRAVNAGIDLEAFIDSHRSILAALRRSDGKQAGSLVRELTEQMMNLIAVVDATD